MQTYGEMEETQWFTLCAQLGRLIIIEIAWRREQKTGDTICLNLDWLAR